LPDVTAPGVSKEDMNNEDQLFIMAYTEVFDMADGSLSVSVLKNRAIAAGADVSPITHALLCRINRKEGTSVMTKEEYSHAMTISAHMANVVCKYRRRVAGVTHEQVDQNRSHHRISVTTVPQNGNVLTTNSDTTKSIRELYETHFEKHDCAPADSILASFAQCSAPAFANARAVMASKGYRFERTEGFGYKVITRPGVRTPEQIKAEKEAKEREELRKHAMEAIEKMQNQITALKQSFQI
jgi:hypothetical protein